MKTTTVPPAAPQTQIGETFFMSTTLLITILKFIARRVRRLSPSGQIQLIVNLAADGVLNICHMTDPGKEHGTDRLAYRRSGTKLRD